MKEGKEGEGEGEEEGKKEAKEEEKKRKTTKKSGLDDSRAYSILARDALTTVTTVTCHRGSWYFQTSGSPGDSRGPTPTCSPWSGDSPQRMFMARRFDSSNPLQTSAKPLQNP